MDILVVFLLLTGVILLTGASLASVIRATGSGLRRHHAHDAQAARARARASAASPRAPQLGARSSDDAGSLSRCVRPSPTPRELIVRATHVEAPSHDWARRGRCRRTADAGAGERAGEEHDAGDAEEPRRLRARREEEEIAGVAPRRSPPIS